MTDDAVSAFRQQITGIDREIVALVNRRLEVVAQLKRYKAEHGIDFVDPQREEQMIAERLAENGGPLSDDGLRALYAELLALTKREVS